MAVSTCDKAFRRGSCVIAQDTAGCVSVLQELHRGSSDAALPALATRAQAVACRILGIGAVSVAILPHGGLLKTGSGKPRRRACLAALQGGSLAPLHVTKAAATALPRKKRQRRAANVAIDADLARVMAALQRVTGVNGDSVDVEAPLWTLGLDSMQVQRIAVL